MQTALKKVIPVNPVFIDTPTGAVAIFGHEHVSSKMLGMLGVVLSHDAFETIYHGVKSVIFRTDGYPKEGDKGLCANFAPDTGSIAINMEKTLELAVERCKEHSNTSLMAAWWLEMLLNFGHELHHSVRWTTEREELHNSKAAREEEEELAEKYSSALLTELVKEYDIEPLMAAEEPWFNEQVGALLSDKSEDPWVLHQRKMLSKGLMWDYETGKDPVTFSTFKDFICLLSNEDGDSDEWNKPVITPQVSRGTLTETVVNPVNTTIEHTLYTESEDYDVLDGIDEATSDFIEEVSKPVQPIIPVTDTNMAVMEDTDEVAVHTGANMDMATAGRIAQQVYMKIYDFIFTQCGQQKDSDVGFSTPEVVCNNPIALTPEEAEMFVSMNHNDINGRWCTDVPTTGGLLGKVMKNTRLPAYELTVALNGHLYRRLVLPQNPAKRNAAGQLTQRATEAQAGDAIMYVINKDSDNKWGPSIINGEYRAPK